MITNVCSDLRNRVRCRFQAPAGQAEPEAGEESERRDPACCSKGADQCGAGCSGVRCQFAAAAKLSEIHP